MKIFWIIFISASAFLLLSFLAFLFLIKPGKRRAQTDKFKNLDYAHRGLHGGGRAENSLSAFKAAADAGSAIELDVRLSSDGVLMVFHDDTLDRMTEVTGRVDSVTAKELSALTLGSTEDTIPTFAEVLELVGGRVPILVEIKEDAGKYCVTEKTVEALKAYKGEFLIESFNPLALARVKKLMPDAVRGILSESFLKEKKYRSPTYFLLQNLLLNFLCKPDFVAFNHEHSKNCALRLVRRIFRVPTLAWTVRSEREERLAKSHGFDGIIFENYNPRR